MAKGKMIGGITVGVAMETSRLKKDVDKNRKTLDKFSKFAKKNSATINRVYKVAFKGVAASAAVAVAGIYKLAKSQEELTRSMNRSLSIMGNVSTAMRKDMRAAAIEAASTTTASSKEAADAFYFLASAGLDAAQSLEALPKVATFAQAGMFDLALATDLLTDAQSALGLSSKDPVKNMKNMERVGDVLVKAGSLANASVQQFSEALTNKAGPALRMVGKDIEEGVAVLAAFADQGIKSNEAGTALDIVLRELQTKAIRFSGEFKKAGIAVYDSSENMRNMGDIVRDLENALHGLSAKGKKSFLLDLGFSDKSVAYVQTLIGTSEKLQDFEKALDSSGGTAARVASKMMTPLEKAMNRLSASFDKTANSMAPLVAMVADLTEDLNKMVSNAGNIKKFFSLNVERVNKRLQIGKKQSFGSWVKGMFGSRTNAENKDYIRGLSKLLQDPKKAEERKAAKRGFKTTGELVRTRRKGVGAASSMVGKVKGGLSFLEENYGADYRDAYKRHRLEQEQKVTAGLLDKVRSGVSSGVSGISSAIESAKWGAQMGLVGAQMKGHKKIDEFTPERFGKKEPITGSLSFAQSGSAESYRQQARIRKQSEADKLDKKRNKELEDIRKTLKENPVVLAVAGLVS